MSVRNWAVCGVLLLGASSMTAGAAPVHKCKNKDGSTSFSDSPCEGAERPDVKARSGAAADSDQQGPGEWARPAGIKGIDLLGVRLGMTPDQVKLLLPKAVFVRGQITRHLVDDSIVTVLFTDLPADRQRVYYVKVRRKRNGIEPAALAPEFRRKFGEPTAKFKSTSSYSSSGWETVLYGITESDYKAQPNKSVYLSMVFDSVYIDTTLVDGPLQELVTAQFKSPRR